MANPAPDEVLIEALAEYQERWGAGETATYFPTAPGPAVADEVRARFERGRACIDLLMELRAEHRPPPAVSNRLRAVGRFEILNELGAGGFGIVYRAFDPHTRRDVALKIPRFEALASDELRMRFEQEARAAAMLDHPNIVHVLEAGIDGALPYIVSNYYPGTTLAGWLKAHPGKLPPRDVATLLAALADGVAHAHSRGVLHRDLKPSNVLLVAAEGGAATPARLADAVPKVLDFGLAKVLDAADNMTRTGAFLGSLHYMSPEQATGRTKDLTVATDVYGLGAILYELLAGAPPFAGESEAAVLSKIERVEPSRIRAQRPDASVDLETICYKCLEKEPARRYASAAELAADLRRYLSGEPIQARRATSQERLWKWCRRNPWWAAMWAAVLLSTLGALASLAYSNVRISSALRSERATRKQLQTQLYAVDLNAAGEAIRRHDPVQARLLLERYTHPQEGSDLREFAWHYLWNLPAEHRHALPRHPADVYSLSLSPDGRSIATACRDGIVRVWQPGQDRPQVEFAFAGAEVNEVAFSPDGQVLAAGAEDGQVRLWDTSDWKERDSFTVGGTITTDIRLEDELRALAVQPNGAVVAVGHCQGRLSVDVFVARYKPNGTLDSSFGEGGIVPCLGNTPYRDNGNAVALQADGRIVVAGWTEDPVSRSDFLLMRLLPDGSADPTFGPEGGDGTVHTDFENMGDIAQAVVLQPDGKIVAAGQTYAGGRSMNIVVARYNSDGTLDPSFGQGGRTISDVEGRDDRAKAVALQPDGKIVVAGQTWVDGVEGTMNILVARYLPDGSLDPTFDRDGIAVMPLEQQDGDHLDVAAYALAIQPDGRIVVAGGAGHGPLSDFVLARYNLDGTLDSGFGAGGIVLAPQGDGGDEALEVVVVPDGRIVAAGACGPEGDRQFALAKFLPDGTADESFGNTGRATVSFGAGDAVVNGLAVGPDGKLVVGGSRRDGHNRADSQNLALARLLPDGTLDSSFSGNGAAGLEFSPDARTLFVCADQLLHAYDISAKRITQRATSPDRELGDLQFSPDGAWVSATDRYNAYSWRLPDLSAPSLLYTANVWSHCVLRDSVHAVVGRNDGQLCIVNLLTGKEVANLGFVHRGGIPIIRRSPDDQLIASASLNSVCIHRTSDWKQVVEFDDAGGRVWDLAFTPDSQAILTADADGYVTRWQISNDSLPRLKDGARELYHADTKVSSFTLAPVGPHLAIGEASGAVKLIDGESGKLLRQWPGHGFAILALDFQLDRNALVSISADGRFESIDLSGQARAEMWSVGQSLRLATFAPGLQQLALALTDKPTLGLRKVADGQELCTIPDQRDVKRLVFSPSGDELIVVRATGLTVLRSSNGDVLAADGRLGDEYHDVAFLPDGRLLVAEGHQGLTIREFPGCRVLGRYQAAQGSIDSVTTSPRGRNFATSKGGGGVYVWDQLTMHPLLPLEGILATHIPACLQFTRDGQLLIGVCQLTEESDRIVVWPARPNPK